MYQDTSSGRAYNEIRARLSRYRSRRKTLPVPDYRDRREHSCVHFAERCLIREYSPYQDRQDLSRAIQSRENPPSHGLLQDLSPGRRYFSEKYTRPPLFLR